jgi:hypothetical protein
VIAGLIGIFTSIVTVVFWIVLSLLALLVLFLFLFVIFHRHTPESTKDVPSSPENTPPPKEVPPPQQKTAKSSDKVLPVEDVNKINLIQIIPSSCYLSPSEERIFKVKATNKMGAEINPGLIKWQATGGSIDSQGKLTVAPRSKGTFKVTAISRVDNLTCSANYTVLPKLTNIEIITTKEIVIPGQDVNLELRGTDQTQAEINIEGKPIWSTTTGEISSKRKLVVDLPNRIVYITVKISGLEAKTTIRVGERPQKVVSHIYPIDIPNPSLKTTPTQDNISIPIVPEHDSEGELSTNEPEQIKESSRLVALEIDAPELLFLKPSQERVFSVHGIDQFGEYIDPGKILWRTTGGKIDSQGKLIVENDAKGSFRVTATFSNAKVSQHRQNLLLIKISLKIFSWVLSHKKFAKDTASHFIQEFCDSELLIDKIFPNIDLNNIDGLLTILIFDDIKELIINTAINVIINYLEKFIALCFDEKHSSLIDSVDYVVLPKLQKLIIQPSDFNIKPRASIDFQLMGIDQNGDKIEIEQKVNWKATGGSIDHKGKLTVNSKSQGSYKVRAIVGNSLNVSANYSVLPKSSDLATSPQLANPDSKQRDSESKSSWSEKGGEIYSADLGSTSTSPQLANPDSKQQDTESKAFWSAKGGKIYSADIGSFPTFILYLPKRTSN